MIPIIKKKKVNQSLKAKRMKSNPIHQSVTITNARQPYAL